MQERRDALRGAGEEARGCTRCPRLAASRTAVVFGAGAPDADVMFVGEAPAREEDEHGVPLAGRPGRLLDELLAGIGLSRDAVYVANAVCCRPPDNSSPRPAELAACEAHLWRQLEIVEPVLVCTLGNFATKLLRGDPAAVTRVHGQAEVRTVGPRAVRLLPLFHPAAALYQAATVEVLRTDMAQIPALVALGAPTQPVTEPEPAAESSDGQLGLF